MKDLNLYIQTLKIENNLRSEQINSGKLSDYNHTAKVHIYNNTLEIIKRLEQIVLNNPI